MLGSQTTRNFYGPGCSASVRKLERQAAVAKPSVVPYVLKDLLNGPCISWKVFKKQEDCLDFAKSGKTGLMSFAFEPRDSFNSRLFLCAHPEVFWHYDSQRDPSERCSYEIITESAVCKLYLDLEFEKSHNPDSNGPEMVNIFIKVLSKALKHTWKVCCAREHVLDLDSSTESKFSRHLIFNLSSACFMNNYHVGNFMKEICMDLQTSIALNSTSSLLQGIDIEDLKKLIIKDSKGNEKLFCDLSVYSKNRHFRLYKSTKKGKNAPLVVSGDNSYPASDELPIFLASLVTYITGERRVLEFHSSDERVKNGNSTKTQSSVEASPSPYPAVDKFVSNLVKPGRISSSFFFSASKIVVFNIVGNRFCGNINRQHKSNNVKYVVDLEKLEYYQKCYDFDCSAYRSPPKPLPPEVVFQIDGGTGLCDSQSSMGLFGLPDKDEAEVMDVIEAVSSTEFSQFSQEKAVRNVTNPSFTKFPSFGLSDEAFNEIDY